MVSIFLSLTVVASKGYLVSFSLHKTTFAFQYLGVVADTFNLFATVTWLFSSDMKLLKTSW